MNVIECGEHFGAAAYYGERVLVVSRRTAVARAALPAVGVDDDVAAAHVYHGLDADAHAVLKTVAYAAASVVGHLGSFMHVATDAMAAHLAHY